MDTKVTESYVNKTVVDVELKAGGRFTARIFTFGGPDLDGDIQVPGSIVNAGGSVAVSAWGHSSHGSAPPVGRAQLREDAAGGVADGRFFLNTQAGREHFEIVRAAGREQQWSYGYDVVERDHEGGHRRILRQVVHEVSPVLLAAGVGTGTIDIDGPAAETSSADTAPELAAIRDSHIAHQLAEIRTQHAVRIEKRYFEIQTGGN